MTPNIVELTLLDGKAIHVNLDIMDRTEFVASKGATLICFWVKEHPKQIERLKEARDGR